MSASELHPRLEEVLGELADEQGISLDLAVQQIERLYDLDLSSVDDDDAEKFAEAFENGDEEGVVEVMEEYDVPEEQIQAFIDQVSKAEQNADTEPEKNGDSPNTSENGSGGLTDAQKREVQEIVSQSVPSSQDIANDLKREMGGGGGGGQPQPQQGGGEQPNPQQQMMLKLLADHLGDSGGGAMSQMGEEATKKVMERSMQRLAKPSFGERIGDAIEQQLSEQVAENVSSGIDLDGMGTDMDVETDDGDNSEEDSGGISIL